MNPVLINKKFSGNLQLTWAFRSLTSPFLMNVYDFNMRLSLTPHCCALYEAFSSHGSWMHHESRCCCGPFNSNLPRSKLSGSRKPSFLYLSAPTKTTTGTLSVLRSLDTRRFCLSIFSSIVLKNARGNVHRVELGEVRLACNFLLCNVRWENTAS